MSRFRRRSEICIGLGIDSWFKRHHPIKDPDPSVIEWYRNDVYGIYGVLEGGDWVALRWFTLAMCTSRLVSTLAKHSQLHFSIISINDSAHPKCKDVEAYYTLNGSRCSPALKGGRQADACDIYDRSGMDE